MARRNCVWINVERYWYLDPCYLIKMNAVTDFHNTNNLRIEGSVLNQDSSIFIYMNYVLSKASRVRREVHVYSRRDVMYSYQYWYNTIEGKTILHRQPMLGGKVWMEIWSHDQEVCCVSWVITIAGCDGKCARCMYMYGSDARGPGWDSQGNL